MDKIDICHSILSYEENNNLSKKIIFRHVTIDSNGSLKFFYKNYDGPINQEIDIFIDSISNYPEISDIDIINVNENPLDIKCVDDCWIVVYLDHKWNWQFSPKSKVMAGFSTKGDFKGKYSDLTHVLKGGTRIKGKLMVDSCRLLYFRARCNSSTFQDGFNLHVDFLLPGGYSTTVIIDPYIRNP